MIKLFFCRNCKRILDRRRVEQIPYEERYKCKWCGEHVLNFYKLLSEVLSDICDYIEAKGKDLDEYE